jgi:hypothetical protein
MGFLRGVGIANETDPDTSEVIALRDSYCWRHRFITALQQTNRIEGSTPEWRRYMSGHRGKDIHENVYTDNPPAVLKPIIDAIPNPAEPQAAPLGTRPVEEGR